MNKLYDILYLDTYKDTVVKHDQQIAETKMEAVKLCRQEFGTGIYIISVKRHSNKEYN